MVFNDSRLPLRVVYWILVLEVVLNLAVLILRKDWTFQGAIQRTSSVLLQRDPLMSSQQVTALMMTASQWMRQLRPLIALFHTGARVLNNFKMNRTRQQWLVPLRRA